MKRSVKIVVVVLLVFVLTSAAFGTGIVLGYTGKGLNASAGPAVVETAYATNRLIIDDIPECLAVQAWTEDNIPMGVCHSLLPVIGVQFHPESFLTEPGELILEHFLEGRF